MKKNIYAIFGLLAISTTIYSFVSPKATGSHPSSTGAPGEATCASSGCHSDATVNAGDIANTYTIKDSNGDDITSYLPGETYTVSISVTDANSSKFGFQVTSLDSSDNFIGELVVTDANRTQLQPYSDPSSLNREYITHTFSGNSQVAAGVGSWTFDWTAPASNSGDISFYYATNATNSNGQNTGDVLYLSSFVITEQSQPNNVEELSRGNLPEIYRRRDNIHFNFELSERTDVLLKVTDINGKLIGSRNLGAVQAGKYSELIQIPNEVSSGVYFASIFQNNKSHTKKIFLK